MNPPTRHRKGNPVNHNTNPRNAVRVTDPAADPEPFTIINNGTPVTCYPITFDDRKMTVHGPDGPRTRTRRNRGGYATAAMLRAMGFNDIKAVTFPGTTDTIGFTTIGEW